MSAKPKPEEPVVGQQARRRMAVSAIPAEVHDDVQALREQYADLQALREACRAAITSTGKTKRPGLLYLVQRLALGHDWPPGDEWRGHLMRILITVTDRPLYSRLGRKRSGKVAERNAAICAEYDALGKSGIRGETRIGRLAKHFNRSPERIRAIVKMRGKRGR